MLKSLQAPILNKFFLDHINEEIRHSLLLKNLADKLFESRSSFKEQELIAGNSANHYFQEVDHYALKFSFSNSILNYLYTTYAIEQRALVFYSLYNDILKKKNFSFSVQSILNDEAEHLDYVMKKIQKIDPFCEIHLEEISQFEHQKYFSFLINLEKDISKHSDLASHLHCLKKESMPSYHKI